MEFSCVCVWVLGGIVINTLSKSSFLLLLKFMVFKFFI
jgi:hypothetical protein